jgi:hypothetical protein
MSLTNGLTKKHYEVELNHSTTNYEIMFKKKGDQKQN